MLAGTSLFAFVASIAAASGADGAPAAKPATLAEVFCLRPGDRLLQVNGTDVKPGKREANRIYHRHRCDAKIDVVMRRLGAASAYPCKPPPCAPPAEAASTDVRKSAQAQFDS